MRNTQLSELPVARQKMAATAAEVVAVRARVLERTVVILERAKHGALARATKAKAEHLAVVAQGVEGKLEYVLSRPVSYFCRNISEWNSSSNGLTRVTKLEIAATLYTPETLAALARYRQHLRQTKERLQHRQKMTVQELRAYGDVEVSDPAADTDADEGTYADIARRYGALAKEVEEVKMEIARLEK